MQYLAGKLQVLDLLVNFPVIWVHPRVLSGLEYYHNMQNLIRPELAHWLACVQLSALIASGQSSIKKIQLYMKSFSYKLKGSNLWGKCCLIPTPKTAQRHPQKMKLPLPSSICNYLFVHTHIYINITTFCLKTKHILEAARTFISPPTPSKSEREYIFVCCKILKNS